MPRKCTPSLTPHQLSSRTLPRASTLASSHPLIRSSLWRTQASGASFSLSAIRYASTVPTTPTPGPASAAQAPVIEPATTAAATPTPAAFNPDTVTLDDIELSVNNDLVNSLPEGIGYLKQIGLDYGYGPTAVIEWTLEHIHIMTGMPWWAAIASTAILMRIVTFPLYLKSADQAARQSALTPITKPITERMTAAQKANDQTGVMQAWSELRAVRKRAGLSYSSQLGPMLAQSVLGFCGFKLMRAMAALPVPGLKEGGFGWITDLTVSDGYLLLPALMAGTMHIMMRNGGETGQSAEMMNPGLRSFMLWGMPGIIFLITGWQAGAIVIWFCASGGWAMGQAVLMQKPEVRKFFGLAPIYRANPADRPKGMFDMALDQTRAGMNERTVTTTATSKAAPKTGPSPITYQAPNVRTTSARGAVNITTAGSTAAKEGVFGRMKSSFNNIKSQAKDGIDQYNAKQDKKAIARAAESYEKRAKERREMEKRGGR